MHIILSTYNRICFLAAEGDGIHGVTFGCERPQVAVSCTKLFLEVLYSSTCVCGYHGGMLAAVILTFSAPLTQTVQLIDHCLVTE